MKPTSYATRPAAAQSAPSPTTPAPATPTLPPSPRKPLASARLRQAFRSGVALLALGAFLLGSSGCATWRDVMTVPEYKLKRKARGPRQEVWEENGRISVFRTIDSGAPLYSEPSLDLRDEQRGWGHFVVAFPALLTECVYMIASSPLLFVASLVAAPAHFEDDQFDYNVNMTPTVWEDYPWWFVTRGVYVVDWLLYDIPRAMFYFPARLFFREPIAWKRRIELEPGRSLVKSDNDYY